MTGIRCYSSPDLLHWKDEGLVLKAVPGDPAHDLHPSKVLRTAEGRLQRGHEEVRHVDAHRQRGLQVGAGWGRRGRPACRAVQLHREACVPRARIAAIRRVFQDDDGKAYRIYSSENNNTTYISLLTDDYLKHSGKFVTSVCRTADGGAGVFKHAGRYWFVGPDCTGWDPNPARSAVADAIWGPWRELGNPCRGLAAETDIWRTEHVHPSRWPGRPGTFIFMADRWNKTDLPDSRYLWLPMRFTENGFEMSWRDRWTLPNDHQ